MKNYLNHKRYLNKRLSVNMVGYDETSFSHLLLLTNKQIANIFKTFPNN